jgi:N utilization substance protein A
VDIKSETEFAQEDQDVEYEGEEQSDGRCMAVLSNGRRCPNAAIAGSTYCGLPQHQALARFETSQAAILAPLGEAEVAILADPDADEGQIAEIIAKAEAEFVEEPEEGTEESAAGPVAESGGPAGGGEASVLGPPDSTPPAEEASEDQDSEGEAEAPVAEEAEQA